MNFSQLSQNKPLLFGLIGGAILIIVLIVVLSFSGKKEATPGSQIIKDNVDLLTTDNIGKALEIQSLLAREGIEVDRIADGSKNKLILKKENRITMNERDRSLLIVVKSGIMDKNIGLEIFDKGDFTSSKEDKRIRLARAINGELSRLIRKIPPIEDASVFVSIPEQTIFTAMKKPTTATVQVTIPSGDKLERDKVRTISNLLLGSVQSLEATNISITDTNGNVYNSIMKVQDDTMNALQENDQYMKNKVMVQLDRLLGKGNYVVTVSTYLRETPQEINKLIYNPKTSAIVSKQNFTESLGDQSRDKSKLSSAVSSYLPAGVSQGPDSSSNRNYSRNAEEYQYGVGKTQILEEKRPGMIEEISIAVTLDRGAMPSSTDLQQLKNLIAGAASPKASANNVEIAFADMTNPYLSSERPEQLPKPEESGNPWWTVLVLFGILLIAGLAFIANKTKETSSKQQIEIEELMQRTKMQQNQIKDTQEQASLLQNQLHNSITADKAQQAIPTLHQTIDDIRKNIEDDVNEEEISTQLKNWIESN
ncbi:MAG: flagellar M-ring protein FliF C-terminal domain-containing protein [Candidatus Gastranaerophilales bacterium]|nr:flagellar M-ring protein FliF C-terminal domain-containing protein [Candidatus Gastranaerophilales bacterium]